MKRERTRAKCQCGCERLAYQNELVEVTIERATDKTLRQSKRVQRFEVLRACKESFEEELAMMYSLQVILEHWTPPARGDYWLIYFWLNPFYPWPAVLWRYWLRVGAALKIMRLQHAIYERSEKIKRGDKAGFQWVHDHAVRSAVLFGCPRFMQSFLARRFLIRAKRKEAKRGAEQAANLAVVEA